MVLVRVIVSGPTPCLRLRDNTGQAIEIDVVWALNFGLDGGPNGLHNQHFFTAGPNNYANGLFGMCGRPRVAAGETRS